MNFRSAVLAAFLTAALAGAQITPHLSKSDWSSIRAEYDRHRQSAFPVEGGFSARNYAQRWTTRFNGHGFEVKSEAGDWSWGLALESYGFAGHEQPAEQAQSKADVEKFSYQWNSSLNEWFVNSNGGLEHGFTLSSRPSLVSNSPLTFHLAVLGTLSPAIASNGLDVSFLNRNRVPTVNYRGLKVSDIFGRLLPARFVLEPQGLRLEIDERKAVYPITVDPVAAIAEQAVLSASNAMANAKFGFSVAVSGNIVAIGAPGEASSATGVNGDQSDTSMPGSGAVYIFALQGNTWTQQAYIKASNTAAGNEFGYAVSLNGNTLVVGSPYESGASQGVNGDETNGGAPKSGAAYVFVLSGGGWSQQAYLKASNTNPTVQANFGCAVSVDADTVIAGAQNEASNANGVNGNQNNTAAPGSGAAYVFLRTGATWAQQAYLKPPSPVTTFSIVGSGYSVSVSGDTVAFGGVALNVSASSSYNSAAVVFVRDGSNWSQQQALVDAAIGQQSQSSVALSGDTLVVGAPNVSLLNQPSNQGEALVYVRNGAGWSIQARLQGYVINYPEYFGTSVAISGDAVAVGGFGDAYLFERRGTQWAQQAYGSFDSHDYQAVAVDATTVVVGSALASENGAAYVFQVAAPSSLVDVFVDSNAPGIPITTSGFGCGVNPASVTPADLLWQPGSSCTLTLPASYNPSLTSRYVFEHWEDGSSNPTRQVTAPDGGGTLTATYQPQYLLTTQVIGPGTINLPSGYYNAGLTMETVAETPATCSAFTGWRVQAGNYDQSFSGPPSAALLMSAPTTITASFSSPTPASASLGNIQSVPGNPGLYSQSISVQNTTTSVADVSVILNGLNNGVNLTSPASPTGTTTACTDTPPTFQQAYFKASNANTINAADESFGVVIALNGDTLVVGAPDENGGSSGINGDQVNGFAVASGAVYVFVRNNGVWTQQAYIKASDSQRLLYFGRSVALSGNTLIVGSFEQGEVYVFVRNGTLWTQQAILLASNNSSQRLNEIDFGHGVALDGDTAVVGSSDESSSGIGVNGVQNDTGAPYSGAAYVFVRNGSTWTQQAYLKASNSHSNFYFGSSVTISGNTIALAAPGESSNATGINGNQNDTTSPQSGAAYVFVRNGTTWTQQAYVKSSDNLANGDFGQALALSGDTLLVGQPGLYVDYVNNNEAFVFTRNGATWGQQAILRPSNRTAYAGFGTSVALDRNTAVVGAPSEASCAKGVNGDETTTPGCFEAGAAYVFLGNGSAWNQGAYLKASNTRAAIPENPSYSFNSEFGSAVAVSGSTVVVGAPNEPGAATGVNGNQSDTSAAFTGAAYGFVLSNLLTGGPLTTDANPYYTVTGVAPGASATVTFDYTAPTPVNLTPSASALIGTGPR